MDMMEKYKLAPLRMVHFVCLRCKRQLVWAEATVSVQCPSCGRWIKANPFWTPPEKGKKAAKKGEAQPEQLRLF